MVARPKPKLPLSFWILSVLVPYALAVTVFAALLYLRTPPRSQHPLESLIDQGGYNDSRPGDIEDPKRDLPADLAPIKLRESRTFNDLEVTPLEVLRQRVTFLYKDGKRDQLSDEEMLVLRLRLANVSHPQVIFHPNDPTFVRGSELSYSFLQIGKRRFYSPVSNVLTERIQGQNFDELLPDASMETIVVAAQELPTSSEGIMTALKKVNANDSLIWRVHLRKGREKIEAKGRSKMVWATTVVPVAFTLNDVKRVAPTNSGP
jgi:hypothetical protein